MTDYFQIHSIPELLISKRRLTNTKQIKQSWKARWKSSKTRIKPYWISSIAYRQPPTKKLMSLPAKYLEIVSAIAAKFKTTIILLQTQKLPSYPSRLPRQRNLTTKLNNFLTSYQTKDHIARNPSFMNKNQGCLILDACPNESQRP